MRQLSKVLGVLFLLSYSVNVIAQSSSAKEKRSTNRTTDNSTDFPFTATYSSKFEMGNPKLALVVLKSFKAYNDNTLNDIGNFFADTLTVIASDGTVLKGKENFINALKSGRSGLSSANQEIVAYMSVKSIDKKDDIVLVWGVDTNTKGDGNVQKEEFHEVWAFNKDGKASFIRDYRGQVPKNTK